MGRRRRVFDMDGLARLPKREGGASNDMWYGELLDASARIEPMY
ncbi:hypothetical protein OsJ_35619 [Oryza sativa Japonica Group]|uniref:Uncharacterized protein n=1 Tax=Oryza sativa subsp. japonica TaxID=39947 RepID=B9GCG0_ORYSJ|nr:hypothetical protein OsJ_35619 [Oryza sativa Japonica Group]